MQIPLPPLYLWDLSQGHRFASNPVNLAALADVAIFLSVFACIPCNRVVKTLGPAGPDP